jgi:glycosyltransferase involved in cell wall biosynthesis
MTEKIYVYPADQWACGHYRLIWPSKLVKCEFDIEVVDPGSRDFRAHLDGNGNITYVAVPEDAAAVVFQRPTHRHIMQSVQVLQRQGVAVIVDMDDDLSTIHPANVAHHIMHPKHGDPNHSWHNAAVACREATLVTCSTPALLTRYATRNNGAVLPNRVPACYLDLPRSTEESVTWCGNLHSHPNDLGEVRGAIASLIRAGYRYRTIGLGEGIERALGLSEEVPSTGPVELQYWATEMSKSGVTIAPLADTSFNQAKSWLKPLEAMATGVPVVMSPRAEYRRLHEESGVGFLAGRPREWERHLRTLLGSADLRQEQSEAGREFVRENHTLEGNAWRWAEAWTTAISSFRERFARVG